MAKIIKNGYQFAESVNIDQMPADNISYNPNNGLTTLNVQDALDELSKQLQDNVYQTKSTNEWYAMSDYIPKYGQFIVFSDYKSITDEVGDQIYVPAIKIGDGVNNVIDLPFITNANSYADVAKKLEHTLTIGTYKFDGTQDISIPIYDGNNNIN